MSSKSQHLHAGHRDRMRERFLQTDGNGMAEHELLELLLFYAIPRCDTNDLAHRLIEEFGSLVGVLEADSSALCAVSGISEKSALYLRLVGKAATLYTAKKLVPDAARDRLDTPEKVAAFLWPKFLGQRVERVILLLLDNSLRLVDCFHVCDGSVSGVAFSMRRITERAYRKNAAAAILAHNHPDGMAIPSGDDMRLTRRVDEALRLLEVPLLEHYIFSDREWTPIMSKIRAQQEKDYAASSLLEIFQTRLDECRALDYSPLWIGQYTKEELEK